MTPPRPYLCYCPACGCPGVIWERSGNSIGAALCTDGNYAGGMIPEAQTLLIHPFCRHYIWHDELLYDWPVSLSMKAVTDGQPGERACERHAAYQMLDRDQELRELITEMFEHLDDLSYGRNPFDPKMRLSCLLQIGLELEAVPEVKLESVKGASAWEAAWQLGVAGDEAERKRFLVRHWWWSINHVPGSWDTKSQKRIPPPPLDRAALTRCLEALLPLLTDQEHLLDKAEALRELGRFDEAMQSYRDIEPAGLVGLDLMRFPRIGQLIEAGSTALEYIKEPEPFTIFL